MSEGQVERVVRVQLGVEPLGGLQQGGVQEQAEEGRVRMERHGWRWCRGVYRRHTALLCRPAGGGGDWSLRSSGGRFTGGPGVLAGPPPPTRDQQPRVLARGRLGGVGDVHTDRT